MDDDDAPVAFSAKEEKPATETDEVAGGDEAAASTVKDGDAEASKDETVDASVSDPGAMEESVKGAEAKEGDEGDADLFGADDDEDEDTPLVALDSENDSDAVEGDDDDDESDDDKGKSKEKRKSKKKPSDDSKSASARAPPRGGGAAMIQTTLDATYHQRHRATPLSIPLLPCPRPRRQMSVVKLPSGVRFLPCAFDHKTEATQVGDDAEAIADWKAHSSAKNKAPDFSGCLEYKYDPETTIRWRYKDGEDTSPDPPGPASSAASSPPPLGSKRSIESNCHIVTYKNGLVVLYIGRKSYPCMSATEATGLLFSRIYNQKRKSSELSYHTTCSKFLTAQASQRDLTSSRLTEAAPVRAMGVTTTEEAQEAQKIHQENTQIQKRRKKKGRFDTSHGGRHDAMDVSLLEDD